MAKGGRKFGGVFSIIGGGLALGMAALLFLGALLVVFADILGAILGLEPQYVEMIVIITPIAAGVLGIVGGILLLNDKTVGGFLVIIGGAIYFILFIILLTPDLSIDSLGMILFYLAPSIIMLIGGIVGIAVGKQ